MTFRDGLLAGRSSIVFLAALITSIFLVRAIERLEDPNAPTPPVALTVGVPVPALAPFDADRRQAAAVAWSYVAAHTRAETGLADSVADVPVACLWSMGSQTMAILAAERLDLIDRAEAASRLKHLLDTLSRLTLADGRLPHRFHDTRTLAVVDRDGRLDRRPRDQGWSAVDLGRLLIGLDAAVRRHPDLAPAVAAILSRWDLKSAVADRALQGSTEGTDGRLTLHQEGRLGWEEYAARGLALWGIDVSAAFSRTDRLSFEMVEGVQVPVDSRPTGPEIRSHLVSEPWILIGIEFGFDPLARELAWRVYSAQEARHRATGRWTAAAEGPIDRRAGVVVSTVFADGRSWATIADGVLEPDSVRTAAVKAAFGWNALYDTPYSRDLLRAMAPLANPGGGWGQGLYETDGRTNTVLALETNAFILEAMLAATVGPLVPAFRGLATGPGHAPPGPPQMPPPGGS